MSYLYWGLLVSSWFLTSCPPRRITSGRITHSKLFYTTSYSRVIKPRIREIGSRNIGKLKEDRCHSCSYCSSHPGGNGAARVICNKLPSPSPIIRDFGSRPCLSGDNSPLNNWLQQLAVKRVGLGAESVQRWPCSVRYRLPKPNLPGCWYLPVPLKNEITRLALHALWLVRGKKSTGKKSNHFSHYWFL